MKRVPIFPRGARGREGVALLLVLLVVVVVGMLALAAIAVSTNSALISMYEDRMDVMESAADAGLEKARADVNAQPTLYSDSSITTLESNAAVRDQSGAVIAGFRRSTYIGPYGVSTGQYGVFAALLSVVTAPNGTRVARRMDVMQESFAKYAYFTDVEGAIYFGGGDRISGPVHSNDVLKIHSTGATFLGPGTVTTALTVQNPGNGSFQEGYTEGVSRIEMPTTADLAKLRGYAVTGGTAFDAPAGAGQEAKLRIEFINIDLNGDGDAIDENEGFFRVYETDANAHLSMGRHAAGVNFLAAGMTATEICGYYDGTRFVTPAEVAGNNATKLLAVKQPNSYCWPAGDPHLNDNERFVAVPGGTAAGNGPSNGHWRARGFALSGAVPAALSGRDDYAYLFPLDHSLNANFKGVIHVNGRVAISGTVRGRLTLAATDNIYVIDDVRYALGPGSSGAGYLNCGDILGLFSGGNITVANNSVNTPVNPDGGNGAPYRTYDESPSEFLHAVVLTLGSFSAEEYSAGPTSGQSCGATSWGRGCLELGGGVIQGTRGAVGLADGHGYLKRYAYDVCGYKRSPPYFPTTGHFSRSRYYELDPVAVPTPEALYGPWID